MGHLGIGHFMGRSHGSRVDGVAAIFSYALFGRCEHHGACRVFSPAPAAAGTAVIISRAAIAAAGDITWAVYGSPAISSAQSVVAMVDYAYYRSVILIY